MDINDLFSLIGDQNIDKLSKKVDLDNDKTKELFSLVVPSIMSALKGNSNSKKGVKALETALDNDHDGSLFDNLEDFIENPKDYKANGILKHAFGSRRTNVENILAAKTGQSSSIISTLLQYAAPLVMQYLGRSRNNSNNSSMGIFDLLSQFMNNNNNNSNNQADSGFDISNIINMFGGNDNNKGGGISNFINAFLGK